MSAKIFGVTTQSHEALELEAAMLRQSLGNVHCIHEAPLLEAIAIQSVTQTFAEQERKVKAETIMTRQQQERRFGEEPRLPILVVRFVSL